MTKSDVSIIITTHNRRIMLQQAIESAFEAGPNIEVIVVDDASSDETEAFCRSLSMIKYVRLEENRRTAGARNAGLLASSSDFVCFMDDDDWRLPNSISGQFDLMRRNRECGLVYGKFHFADHEGNILNDPDHPSYCPEGDVFQEMLRMNFLGCMTALIRRSIFDRVGMFDTSERMYGIEDWDMWLRIAEDYKFLAVKEPVAVYRKPSRNSRQWSSDIPRQFGRIGAAYKNKWFYLQRAKELIEAGTVSKNELLDKVADRILYDMATNSEGFGEKIHKTMVALRCRPAKLGHMNFYKTLVRSFVA